MTDETDEGAFEVKEVSFEGLGETGEVAQPADLSAKDVLGFAQRILFWIAVIFLLSCLAYIVESWITCKTGAESTGAAKEVFEFCKQTLPPIVTLILGTYFASSKS